MKFVRKYTVSKVKAILSFFSFLVAGELYAQTPRNVPNSQDTYSFDLAYLPDLILYIVLPVVIIVLYLLYRRREKKRRNK